MKQQGNRYIMYYKVQFRNMRNGQLLSAGYKTKKKLKEDIRKWQTSANVKKLTILSIHTLLWHQIDKKEFENVQHRKSYRA